MLQQDQGRDDNVGGILRRDLILHILIEALKEMQQHEFQKMHWKHSHVNIAESISHTLPLSPLYGAGIKGVPCEQGKLAWFSSCCLG